MANIRKEIWNKPRENKSYLFFWRCWVEGKTLYMRLASVQVLVWISAAALPILLMCFSKAAEDGQRFWDPCKPRGESGWSSWLLASLTESQKQMEKYSISIALPLIKYSQINKERNSKKSYFKFISHILLLYAFYILMFLFY